MTVFLFLSTPVFLIMLIDYIVMRSPASYGRGISTGTRNWTIIIVRFGIPFLICIPLFPILQLIKDVFPQSYKPMDSLINLVVGEHLIPLLIALFVSLLLYRVFIGEGVGFYSIDFLHILVTLGGFFTANSILEQIDNHSDPSFYRLLWLPFIRLSIISSVSYLITIGFSQSGWLRAIFFALVFLLPVIAGVVSFISVSGLLFFPSIACLGFLLVSLLPIFLTNPIRLIDGSS